MLAKLEALGVGGFGEIHLRLAVAESLHALGRTEAAGDALGKTLDKLSFRINDIPDAAVRERYITAVPTHARLLELAKEWLPDCNIRDRIGMDFRASRKTLIQ